MLFYIKAYAQNLIEGTVLGYESLSGGRVATRFYKTKYGTLSEYIDATDFPQEYQSVLREIYHNEIPSDMKKAREILNLMYRYPFKVGDEIVVK